MEPVLKRNDLITPVLFSSGWVVRVSGIYMCDNPVCGDCFTVESTLTTCQHLAKPCASDQSHISGLCSSKKCDVARKGKMAIYGSFELSSD